MPFAICNLLIRYNISCFVRQEEKLQVNNWIEWKIDFIVKETTYHSFKNITKGQIKSTVKYSNCLPLKR